MTIYKIEQFEGTEDLGSVNISFEDLNALEQLELNQVILEDTGSYVIGLFTDEYLTFIKFLFEKHDINYSVTDVTSQFIKNTPILNMFKGKEDQIKSFVLSNVSVDDILDKINKSGMESLNEMDYMVLNK